MSSFRWYHVVAAMVAATVLAVVASYLLTRSPAPELDPDPVRVSVPPVTTTAEPAPDDRDEPVTPEAPVAPDPPPVPAPQQPAPQQPAPQQPAPQQPAPQPQPVPVPPAPPAIPDLEWDDLDDLWDDWDD